jgi:hypothetical protein
MRDLTLYDLDNELAEQLPARELMGCCPQSCTPPPCSPPPPCGCGGGTIDVSVCVNVAVPL